MSCPLCEKNGKLSIVQRFKHTTIVRAMQHDAESSTWRPIEGAFRLISVEHIPSGCVPGFDFYRALIDAKHWLEMTMTGGRPFDNISLNLTTRGGMKVDHTHAWIIDRGRVEEWLRNVHSITDIVIREVGMVGLLEDLILSQYELRETYRVNGDARGWSAPFS